jgi:hypothetical protein
MIVQRLTKVHFTIDNTDYAEFMDTSNKLSVDTEFDSLGFAAVKVKGINPGKDVVTATGKIEGDSEGMNNSPRIEIIK